LRLKEMPMPDLDQIKQARRALAVFDGLVGHSRRPAARLRPRGCRDGVNHAARLLLAGEGKALTRKAVEPAMATPIPAAK
jgi:hypothetical protein